MNDLEVIIAMLDRAKIGHTDPEPLGPDRIKQFGLPEGAVAFDTADESDYPFDQPFDGGYSGFFTEFVFDAEGTLLAVWGWE